MTDAGNVTGGAPTCRIRYGPRPKRLTASSAADSNESNTPISFWSWKSTHFPVCFCSNSSCIATKAAISVFTSAITVQNLIESTRCQSLNLLVFYQIHNLFQTPNMVGYSRIHRWRHTQSLMHPAKVVIHEVKGNRRFVAGSVIQAQKRIGAPHL